MPARRLLGAQTPAPTAKVRAAVRRIVRKASKQGQPFGPGSLKDYEITEDKTAIRFALMDAKAG